MSQTDLTVLNARLAALGLPPQTEHSLAALPAGLTLARIEHALSQAEGGQQGARLFLARNLSVAPGAAPDRPAPGPLARPTPPNAPAPGPTPSASAPTPSAPAAGRPPRWRQPRRQGPRRTHPRAWPQPGLPDHHDPKRRSCPAPVPSPRCRQDLQPPIRPPRPP